MQLASINFFIPCYNWKTLFFLKVCRYRHIVALFDTKVLKEVRCLPYLQCKPIAVQC